MSRRSAPLTPEQAIRLRRIRIIDRRALWSLLRKAAFLALIFYLLFGVFFGVTTMKGDDMRPKFSAGDILIYYRLYDNYSRNDIVLVSRSEGRYAGRIIGAPGDRIDITDEGAVVINGAALYELDIYFQTKPIRDAVEFPITLGEDEYFILGDNRTTAKDSRYFGTVKADELRGRIVAALRRTDI